jgi:hypothetical protein
VAWIDLLKVDIEGGEEELFADADFLSRVGLGIIELHGTYDQDRFQADLSKYGYEAIPPDATSGAKMLTFSRKQTTVAER